MGRIREAYLAAADDSSRRACVMLVAHERWKCLRRKWGFDGLGHHLYNSARAAAESGYVHTEKAVGRAKLDDETQKNIAAAWLGPRVAAEPGSGEVMSMEGASELPHDTFVLRGDQTWGTAAQYIANDVGVSKSSALKYVPDNIVDAVPATDLCPMCEDLHRCVSRPECGLISA